jgi:hypothetical protein
LELSANESGSKITVTLFSYLPLISLKEESHLVLLQNNRNAIFLFAIHVAQRRAASYAPLAKPK